MILGNHLLGVALAGEGDHCLDAALGDVVQGASAGNGLPDFHGPVDGTRHHSNFFEVVAAIGNGRGYGVVLALVAPGFLIERLEDDFHLFQEQFPVGVVVDDGGAEGFHLAGVVAAADAENHPPAGEDVGHGEVLGHPQGVPHWDDVESLAELQVFGLAGQVDAHQDEVGDALVAFVLEVVFGHPHTVEAALVHMLRQGVGVVVSLGQPGVGVAAAVGRRAVCAHIVQVDLPHIENREPLNHSGDAPVGNANCGAL